VVGFDDAPFARDHRGDVPKVLHLIEQIAIVLKKSIIHKVVVLDAGEGQSKLFLTHFFNRRWIIEEFAGGGFPNAPSLGGFQLNLSVRRGEAAMVGFHETVSLVPGNRR
jgi:hypothetical protein